MVWRAEVNSVLIVDDEGGMRKLLNRWLSSEGYEIREAADAETALEEITRAAPDVVMCDVDMPGRGGLWLAEQIRERYPATAVVLATALSTVPPVVSLRSGIVEYLVKPFARDRVLRAVAAGVQWHTAESTRRARVLR
jgi:DNA-binding NtrC family response regulator